jgi:hypothetical protein
MVGSREDKLLFSPPFEGGVPRRGEVVDWFLLSLIDRSKERNKSTTPAGK